MGGLFSAPKPVELPPPAPVAAAETVADAASRNEQAAEDSARGARLRAVERARRGLAGTIATGARGVLAPLPNSAARKTLLGE